MSKEERMRVLQVVPAIAAKAEEILTLIEKGVHLEGLMEEGIESVNLFGLKEKHAPVDYSNKPENLFVREKDGTMLVNVQVSDLQKKAIKSIIGQIAKKIMSADLTGLNLPVFMFHSDTYLHK